MKSDRQPDRRRAEPQEIELKLALPTSDASRLAAQLAGLPALARLSATHQHLHNVYYDTPEQLLRHKRIALRIRRTGGEAQAQWLMTLKTGGRGNSALSQRGEWETAVPDATLALQALEATPWSGLDPDGTVFRALAPCFVTSFERTSWSVHRRDGSWIEVALDIGQIAAGEKTAPLCELELELLAGPPAALFRLAQQIARSIAVLPATMSKAERGYTLAEGRLAAPLGARPPKLNGALSVSAAAARVLGEMFGQFTTNLNGLCACDDPELLHQARVGWRRFKSALRLFKPVLSVEALPSWQALKPLWAAMGELRDLDVALGETLPPLADAYAAGDARRVAAWAAMTQGLRHAGERQRASVRDTLQMPAVGASLLATTQWLEGLSAPAESGASRRKRKGFVRRWARRRLVRLHERLKAACRNACDPNSQHRVRILAKRTRYATEALRCLLPKRRSQRWQQQATSLQADVGAARDLMQASVLAARLEADRGLVEFLRGIAVGQPRRRAAVPHSAGTGKKRKRAANGFTCS